MRWRIYWLPTLVICVGPRIFGAAAILVILDRGIGHRDSDFIGVVPAATETTAVQINAATTNSATDEW